MKTTHQQEKREKFASTFSNPSHQIATFNDALCDVLETWELSSKPLKDSVRKVESLLDWWISFCEDIGFFAFQKYLLDIESQWSCVFSYIKTMPTTLTQKHIKKLTQLAKNHNPKDTLTKAVQTCSHLQEYFNDAVFSTPTSTTSFQKKEESYQDFLATSHGTSDDINTTERTTIVSSLNDDLFGWWENENEKDFFVRQLEEEDIQEKERKKTMDIVKKKYYFTSEWVPILKSTFDSLSKKLNNN